MLSGRLEEATVIIVAKTWNREGKYIVYFGLNCCRGPQAKTDMQIHSLVDMPGHDDKLKQWN